MFDSTQDFTKRRRLAKLQKNEVFDCTQGFAGAERLSLTKVRQHEVFDCAHDFTERRRLAKLQKDEVFDCPQGFTGA